MVYYITVNKKFDGGGYCGSKNKSISS
jgi:hypothetical protein